MIFCLRCNGHVTLHDDEVTFLLRISNESWQVTKALFVSKGFINSDNEIINWDKRQYLSDSSAERVARHRAKKKDDVTPCNVTVTPPEQIQNRTDTENINTLVRNDVTDNCPLEKITELYHEHLPMLTKVKVLNPKRKTQIRTRWREDPKRQSLEYWARLFAYVSKSDFLTGKAGKWQADLEWITNSTNFVKIIEGKYENKAA
jgi:hypothetical protein